MAAESMRDWKRSLSGTVTVSRASLASTTAGMSRQATITYEDVLTSGELAEGSGPVKTRAPLRRSAARLDLALSEQVPARAKSADQFVVRGSTDDAIELRTVIGD